MAFWKSTKRTSAVGGSSDAEELDSPWRNVIWNKNALVEELRKFSLSNEQVKHLQLLMHGAIGAGKSSFVNSVNSAFQNRVTSKAIMSTGSATSCTKTYKGFKIKNGKEKTMAFMFYDTMGLEIGVKDRVHPDDINNALRGHLPNGYKFNPHNPSTPEDIGYIIRAPLEEKTHCLICVVSGNSISQMPNEIISKMKLTLNEATDIGVPQVVIMTFIDEVCPLVKKDLKNVYKSKKIKEKMLECSANLSIPMSCTFPVKNYHEETETNDDIDVLLLYAMKQIVHFANDFIEQL